MLSALSLLRHLNKKRSSSNGVTFCYCYPKRVHTTEQHSKDMTTSERSIEAFNIPKELFMNTAIYLSRYAIYMYTLVYGACMENLIAST